jgi:hypothetical protein
VSTAFRAKVPCAWLFQISARGRFRFAFDVPEALPLIDLKQIALKKIREHRGCDDVEDLSLCPIRISNTEYDWAISCGVGGSDKAAASKAALYVQEEMRMNYELLIDDSFA